MANSPGIQTFKQPGAAQVHLNELDRCRKAVIMVGHCRYATHGSPEDNRNNHPHPAGAGRCTSAWLRAATTSPACPTVCRVRCGRFRTAARAC